LVSDVLKKNLSWSFNGKPLPIGIPDWETEQAFTNWLEMRARDKIERRRKLFVEAGTYELHVRIWQSGVDADRYDWAGQTAWESRNNEPGQKELLWLMLVKETPGVLRDLVDKIFADPFARDELFRVGNKDAGTQDGLYWRAVSLGRPTIPETPKEATPEAA
jgi:hypothetical protein